MEALLRAPRPLLIAASRVASQQRLSPALLQAAAAAAARLQAAAVAPSTAADGLDALLREHGVFSALKLVETGHGRGLAPGTMPAGAQRGPGGRPVLVSVPLRLVLSATIPGCCPEALAAPELAGLLASDAPWELQIGGLLLWARWSSGGGPLTRFWRAYAAAALPQPAEMTSLLHFTAEELGELQDGWLAASAAAWRAQALAAFALLVDAPAMAAACGGRRPALGDWLWAVGAVESRAFGVRVGGAEAQGLVPVLDLANHAPGAATSHGLAAADGEGAAASGAFQLWGPPLPGALGTSDGDGGGGGQLFISYGDKANAQLMHQYGFSIPGNPHDRLSFGPPPPGGPRLRRELLANALAAVGAGDDAAGKARLAAAMASLLKAYGWRSMAEFAACTPSGQRTALAEARAWCGAQLAAMPTSAAQDVALLEALPSSAPNARLRAAVAYRLERKRCLLAASALCDGALAALGQAGE
jgi:hypothetical protein